MSDTTKGSVAQAYDRWAATYDDDRNVTRDLDAIVLRDSGLPLAGAHVIEVGAGTGKNTQWLAARARQVTALDFSSGMLARARERVTAPHVMFARCDLRTAWPVKAGSADIVIGNLVLEHIADVGWIFAETARALRDGGIAFFCELHPDRQARGGQAQFTDRTTGERVFVDAIVHTREELAGAAEGAGLRVERIAEHLEAAGPVGSPPRLLSMLLAGPTSFAHDSG